MSGQIPPDTAEYDAIRSVLEGDISSYLARDRDTWEQCWVTDDRFRSFMIENVHKHLERRQDREGGLTAEQRWRIVADATSEVGPPVFFSLLIITLSFLPVFTLEAQEGRLFAPLAYTKTYAMDRRRRWVEEYERKSGAYASCQFVDVLGTGRASRDCERVKVLHDRYCKVESGLPLA